MGLAIKRIVTGLLLMILVAGALWWALGRGGGPQARTFNLAVLDQKLYGAGEGIFRVKQGDMITLQITADEPMEVFLHGYDLETLVKPNLPGTIQFSANLPGAHALMIHALWVGEGDNKGSHKGKRRVEILLGFVEVLPQR